MKNKTEVEVIKEKKARNIYQSDGALGYQQSDQEWFFQCHLEDNLLVPRLEVPAKDIPAIQPSKNVWVISYYLSEKSKAIDGKAQLQMLNLD